MKIIDFIKEYEYKEVSDVMFKMETIVTKDTKSNDIEYVEIRDPSYKYYNAMGMVLSWCYEDSKKAKKIMSRKKFRRLNNRILRRLGKYRSQ